MADKLQYNIIATVRDVEVDLAPYPGGGPTVPADKYRKIYAMVLSNSAAVANTLTINVYRGASLERSISVVLAAGGSISIVSNIENPILIIPPGRTLRAVATSASIYVLMAGVDE